MPQFTHSDRSPHSIEELTSLVLDVEKYPEFLPWCQNAHILSYDAEKGQMLAEMTITFTGFSETYTSAISITKHLNKVKIQVEAISGPFKYLNNYWCFEDDGTGTTIEFSIDFAFKSKLLEMMLGAVFAAASHKMVSAFEKRADKLFGQRTFSNDER